eukprot:Sspe_Gene.18372::Locus_6595_Transcript_1_1_Confidence_1.000_Length_1056::g.18372::m.18372
MAQSEVPHLDVLHRVRELLAERLPLPTDYEIELREGGGPFLGEATVCYSPWEDSTARVAEVKKVVLYSKRRGARLPLEYLLLTFLHELAHTITPAVRDDRGNLVEHSAAFYDNYAQILRVAEEAQVLVLPAIPAKFSRAALERLDAIDGGDERLHLGHSPLFSEAPSVVRVALLRGTASKVVLLPADELTLANLQHIAKAKYRAKPKALRLKDGTPLTDLALQGAREVTVVIG